MVSNPYQAIGVGYGDHRRPDPRIAEVIDHSLGDARNVVNVGAGPGSYEPRHRRVTAVEPSTVMIEQRPTGSAPVVQGYAEDLPFADHTFDAGMAILTVHHWTNAPHGLAELRRVSTRQTVLTWDPAVTAGFWLVKEYLPEIADAESGLATLTLIQTEFKQQGADVRATTVPVPADCTDGFLAAYWQRPHSYLDPHVRGAISALANLDQAVVERAMERLADDLTAGRWHERHADLLAKDAIDAGYRLVTAL